MKILFSLFVAFFLFFNNCVFSKSSTEIHPKNQVKSVSEIINYTKRVGECMAVWAFETRINASTGLILKNVDKNSTEAQKFLDKSQNYFNMFNTAYDFSIDVLADMIDPSGVNFTQYEIQHMIISNFIIADRTYLMETFSVFGTDFRFTEDKLKALDIQSSTCKTFMSFLTGETNFQ